MVAPSLRYYRTVASITPSKLKILRSEELAAFPWLVHGFSTRVAGVSRAYGGNTLNLGFTRHDTRTAVERNRELFLQSLSAKFDGSSRNLKLINLRQIHSDLIHCVDHVPEHILAGDGLITNTPGLLLAVLTADCLPIIVADKKSRAVGVFHAGWRGTVKRIAEKGVGEMRKHFGSIPRNLVAVIGPGIQRCCYEVGQEVREKFRSQFGYADTLFHEVKESDHVRERYPLLFLTARAPGHSELPVKLFLDMVQANRHQLLDAGIPAGNIEAFPLCTACNTELLFSHRAEKGITGRMMGAVGVRGQR